MTTTVRLPIPSLDATIEHLLPARSALFRHGSRCSDDEECTMVVHSSSEGTRLADVPFRREPLDSRFLDREDELAAIRSRVLADEVRLLTLTGPGGVGKTRLAIEVGSEVRSHFAHGVVFVDLTPVRDPDTVLAAVAESLGFGEFNSPMLLQRLQAYLANCDLLLILDNVEQVLPVAPALAELLAAAPGLKLLITSRKPLHLRCERVFSVPPLPLPNPRQLPSLAKLSQVPAVALFLQRAQAINRHFALTEDNARAVAELVVRLDGLPLAIELAAARTILLSPQMILERLGQRLSLLRWEAQDLPQRQQTLRSALAWSYELLFSEEQTLFRRLGVFAGSFSLMAAEAIAEPLAADSIEGLASLVDESLVQVQAGDEDMLRYVLLESTREYALERLEEEAELEEARRCHALHYLDLAERAEPELYGRRQATWLRRLEAEHDNLQAALRWLLDAGKHEQALQLAGALGQFWWLRGYHTEGGRWLEEALGQAPDAHPRVRTRAVLQAAQLWTVRDDRDLSTAAMHEALALAKANSDRPAIARALTFLGASATAVGQVAEGERLLREALALWEELGSEYHIAYALASLADVCVARRRYQEAAQRYTAAICRWQGLGELAETASVLFPLALTWMQLGDRTAAAQLVQDGLKRSLACGDRWGVSMGAEATLLLVNEDTDVERKARLLGATDAVAEGTGVRTGILEGQSGLSLAALREQIEREGLQHAFHAGRTVSFEDAGALALTLLEELARTLADGNGKARKPAEHSLLSPREQEVLGLVAEGLTNKEIAKRLIVSVFTIKAQVVSVFNKLGVDSRAQAVAVAARQGLLDEARGRASRAV